MKTTTLRFWVETYYGYQRQRIQTGNRICSHLMRKLEPEKWQEKKEKDEKSYGKDWNFKEVKQKYNENISIFSNDEKFELNMMLNLVNRLNTLELDISKEIKRQVQTYDIYNKWLKDVTGISHILGAGLIAWIGDIDRFDTISKLWAYSGLGVFDGKIQQRKRGEKSNWNNKLKVHAWKISDSFVRTKGFYRELYDKYKAYELTKNPEPIEIDGKKNYTAMHIHMRAKRKTVKVFMSHLWVRWRELEGLPVTKPYCEAYLGHKTLPVP